MFAYSLLAVILGFFIDLVVGDPHWLYHPIRLIGAWIAFLEKHLRNLFGTTKRGEQVAGFFLVALVVSVSTMVPFGILYMLRQKGLDSIAFSLETIWCYQILATKSLKVESMKVYQALKEGTIEDARKAVSMIVGRDTKDLTREGVTKAAVETVAENTSDGIVAPLLFLVIGGAPAGFFYKSINTMDSMVGYKNERYRYFGTMAAKLDDIVNFLPARMSAVFMIVASRLLGYNWKQAAKIFHRDRFNHASPNSAQTEAVMAGALGVQLAGDAWYFGVLHKKPTIGEALRSIEPEDIKRANRLLYATAILSLVVFVAGRGVFVVLGMIGF